MNWSTLLLLYLVKLIAVPFKNAAIIVCRAIFVYQNSSPMCYSLY
jgi:hypothetical protein